MAALAAEVPRAKIPQKAKREIFAQRGLNLKGIFMMLYLSFSSVNPVIGHPTRNGEQPFGEANGFGVGRELSRGQQR